MSLMKSWVASANTAETPFPLNNLPYGVFSTKDTDARCGVAIGDMILDVAACEAEGLISLDPEGAFDLPFWNDVMELGADVWAKLRARLVELLQEGSPHEVDVAPLLVSQFDAEMHLPLMVNEFTDFYAGKHHATNVGTMFRGPENALPPNWLHIPIGYNGRASTVVVSGTDITRPNGQTKAPDAEMPSFGPCKRLDIELEMGAIVGSSQRPRWSHSARARPLGRKTCCRTCKNPARCSMTSTLRSRWLRKVKLPRRLRGPTTTRCITRRHSN
jgi:fumarylacetoacetase